MGKISIALSSRTIGALPSSIESLAFTPGTKSIETCKSISSRIGKEYEFPSLKDQDHNQQGKNKEYFHVSKGDRAVTDEKSPLVEKVNEEGLYIVKNNMNTLDMTPTNVKVSPNTLKSAEQEYLCKTSPPSFPQRIRKAKEEQ